MFRLHFPAVFNTNRGEITVTTPTRTIARKSLLTLVDRNVVANVIALSLSFFGSFLLALIVGAAQIVPPPSQEIIVTIFGVAGVVIMTNLWTEIITRSGIFFIYAAIAGLTILVQLARLTAVFLNTNTFIDKWLAQLGIETLVFVALFMLNGLIHAWWDCREHLPEFPTSEW